VDQLLGRNFAQSQAVLFHFEKKIQIVPSPVELRLESLTLVVTLHVCVRTLRWIG
jgi:hypothetical protein